MRGEDSVLVIDIDRATPEIFYSTSAGICFKKLWVGLILIDLLIESYKEERGF